MTICTKINLYITTMKKSLIIVSLLFIIILSGNAQCPLTQEKYQINAGIGFSGWGIPLYAGFDYGVQHDITIGVEGSLRSYNQDISNLTYNSTILGLSGNGNYHFDKLLELPSNWDFYAGLNIGYYFWSRPSNYPSYGTGASGIGIGAQIGGRYFFKKNFGLNLEFGGGNVFSSGKLGITYILD